MVVEACGTGGVPAGSGNRAQQGYYTHYFVLGIVLYHFWQSSVSG